MSVERVGCKPPATFGKEQFVSSEDIAKLVYLSTIFGTYEPLVKVRGAFLAEMLKKTPINKFPHSLQYETFGFVLDFLVDGEALINRLVADNEGQRRPEQFLRRVARAKWLIDRLLKVVLDGGAEKCEVVEDGLMLRV